MFMLFFGLLQIQLYQSRPPEIGTDRVHMVSTADEQ